MIVDLHCHYPMHLVASAGGPGKTLADRLRGLAISLVAQAANHSHFLGDWRVSLDGLRDGDVGLALSVLYSPFSELDLTDVFAADPEYSYYEALTRQLNLVEAELEGRDGCRIVKTKSDFEAVIAEGSTDVGIAHAVEGGFHLGRDPDVVEGRVAELARRGVVYITLAHLVPRAVAANAPALPFFSDKGYDSIFFQPIEGKLPPVGEAAVRAMYAHRVLIDITHMREDAINATFELLDQLDRAKGRDPRDFPVIATHAGYRFGAQHYMLTPRTIRKIAGRDGLIGLIMAQHQLNDGRDVAWRSTLAESAKTIRAHADAIERIAGSGKPGSRTHVAIGTDLDGFVTPTVSGIEKAEDLAKLRTALLDGDEFPEEDVQAILRDNAVEVLRKVYERRG